MKVTDRVSDRNKIQGVRTDVEIEAEQIGGSSSDTLEVAERISEAVKDEIDAIAEENED